MMQLLSFPRALGLQLSFFLLLLGALSSICPAQSGGLGGGLGGQGGGPSGGFGGPAVLGRGAGSTTGQRAGADVALRFYAGVTASFDSGLTGFSVDSAGNIIDKASKGGDAIFGVYGTKRLRRGQFGINYQGGYHQSTQKLYNGTDQSLALFYSTQVNKRSQLSVNSSVGTTNRAIGIPIGGGFIDNSATGYTIPTNEIFDNRFYYGGAGGQYVIQRSARLSLALTGNLFVTRRTGNVLFGSNGAYSGANLAYRLSRRQTLSVGYQFFVFNYTRNFGDSYGNGLRAGYSAQISSSLMLSLQGGVTRLESLGLRTVSIDPVIAALIGRSFTQEVYYGISYIPNGTANLTYRVTKLSSLNTFGTLYVSPGNGVINTSRNLSGGAVYGYTGLRVASLSASLNYSRLSSVVGDHQSFETISSAFSANRKLSTSLHATGSVGNRRFLQSSTNTFKRNTYFAMVGIVWSPGELPLSIR